MVVDDPVDVESTGTGVTAPQAGALTVFVSRVTAPPRAKSRPVTNAPVVAVTDVCARIVPTRVEVVPSVAELPTCQNTLQALAPLRSNTWLPELVTRLLAAWNKNTALGSL